MKNQRQIFILLISFVTLNLFSSPINGQFESLCTTSGGAGAIGVIPPSGGTNNNTLNTSDPFFIKVYVHVIRKPDGSGGQSHEAIDNAFQRLNNDFTPHNIFFVRDCEVIDIPVSNDDYFDFGISCDLWTNPDFQHDDGIDMFFGSEEITNNAGGVAQEIPGKALWMGGTWPNGQGAPWNVIESAIISHEMGHCLGLFHTHHGTLTESNVDCSGNSVIPTQCCELVNGSNSASCGDFVQDTPADPRFWYQQFTTNPPCAGGLSWFSTGDSDCMTSDQNTNARRDANGEIYTPSMANIMSYNGSKLCQTEITTGQGERMRQMISFSPILQACLVEPDFTSHNISTTTTWSSSNTPNNGDFLIEDELIIETGATLTINSDVTVRFGDEGRLIVEQGARLNLRGTLTSRGCGLSWKGIEVWGNSSLSQGSSTHGFLVALTGSTIENAETAAKLYGPSYTQHAGGMYAAHDNLIQNCIIGLEFAPHQSFFQGQPRNYVGYFTDSRFRVNDDYPHDEAFHSFVHMTGVRGVRIGGSEFTNSMTIEGTEIDDWGYGIFANDAGFDIREYIYNGGSSGLVSQKSTFTNLGYGVYSAKIVNNQPFLVRESDFNNCFLGIRNKSVNGSTILNNDFTLGNPPSFDVATEQSGINFETDISGLTCQENEFINPTGTDVINTIGIFCSQTGEVTKTIRKNTFTNLTRGNLANGQNGANPANDPFAVRGVNYLCNQNFNVQSSGADFDVASGWIRKEQGLVDPNSIVGYKATGNLFSYTGTDFIHSGNDNIRYFYDNQGINEEPITFAGDFTPDLAPENTCPTEYCEPPCKPKSEIKFLKENFTSNQTNYQLVLADYQANPTDEKLQQLNYLRHTMDESVYMITLHQMYDTLDYSLDSLLLWVDSFNSVSSKLWLANELLAKGDATSALQTIDNISLEYGLTDDEQSDISSYQDIASTLVGQEVYQLNDATLASIKNYTEEKNRSGEWAKNILTLYGAHFPPEYILSNDKEDTKGEQPSNDTNQQLENTKVNRPVSVYPNPAKELVNFKFRLPENATAVLEVTDYNGRMIRQFEILPHQQTIEWNTSQVGLGIYFYQLKSPDESLESGKIVIIK